MKSNDRRRFQTGRRHQTSPASLRRGTAGYTPYSCFGARWNWPAYKYNIRLFRIVVYCTLWNHSTRTWLDWKEWIGGAVVDESMEGLERVNYLSEVVPPDDVLRRVHDDLWRSYKVGRRCPFTTWTNRSDVYHTVFTLKSTTSDRRQLFITPLAEFFKRRIQLLHSKSTSQ